MRAKIVGVMAAAAAMTVVWGGAASAHVTVSPPALPQGSSDAILTFRVPNESTTAAVVGLRIQLPTDHPIIVVSPEAGSGWQVAVHTVQLPRPITTDDGTFTSVVTEIDWSGASIPVGQFGEFDLLAQGIPSGTDNLVFKALQQYSDGTTVSWIQVPDSSAPTRPTPPRSSSSRPPAVGRAPVCLPTPPACRARSQSPPGQGPTAFPWLRSFLPVSPWCLLCSPSGWGDRNRASNEPTPRMTPEEPR